MKKDDILEVVALTVAVAKDQRDGIALTDAYWRSVDSALAVYVDDEDFKTEILEEIKRLQPVL